MKETKRTKCEVYSRVVGFIRPVIQWNVGKQSRYDAVVIGAGPAGSMAALEITNAGHSALLLEKHEVPGTPLCCAEAVSQSSFNSFFEPRPEWISTFIDKIILSAPMSKEVKIFHPRAGYILDRKKFDYDLAMMAKSHGSDLQCKAIGLQLHQKNGIFNSIDILDSSGDIHNIKADIFVAADGVESKIARLAGIDNRLNIEDVESILQYRLENISIDPETIELHVGNKIAPKGYLWVFPKSHNSANVGVGLTADSGRGGLCKGLLDSFINSRFDTYKIAFKSSGMTPKFCGKKMLRKHNLLVTGDAARVLDSLSGAGIINALWSGKYAGLAASKYLSKDVDDIEALEEYYPGRFLKFKGEELAVYKRLRDVFIHLDDDDFANIAKALSEHFKDGIILGIQPAKLLIHIVRTRPRLLRLVRYLI